MGCGLRGSVAATAFRRHEWTGTVTLFHASFRGTCRPRRIYHSIPILLCGKLGICPFKRNCLLNSHKLLRFYRFTKTTSSFHLYIIFKKTLINTHSCTHVHVCAHTQIHLLLFAQKSSIQYMSSDRSMSSFCFMLCWILSPP